VPVPADRDLPLDSDSGTVVITHRVAPEHQQPYDAWLDRIGPVCRASPGLLDWQIIRPVPGLTTTYTVILRFDSRKNLATWMDSEARAELIAEVDPLLAMGDEVYIKSGLDFWFTPEGAEAKLPTRWKQFLITWSAIFPLAAGTPLLVVPLLRRAGLPAWPQLDTLIVTGFVVAAMVYVVMPRYTKLVSRWLFE
jgi:uncharacterized protein